MKQISSENQTRMYQYEIIVSGKVQGVGFRYYAHKRALEHHITGYVQNIPDNRVLIVAEGRLSDLKTFRDYMQLGPPMARVVRLSVSLSPFTGSYSGFEIKHGYSSPV
jgi:acylphosphatase